jgi:hypothetical protein
MIRFIEKTAPIKVKAKLPYIEDALEYFADMVSDYRNNTKLARTSYIALFNKVAGEIDDREKSLILDIIQDWDEIKAAAEE